MAGVIFSHPQYVPSGNYTIVGYNLFKSSAAANTTSNTAVSSAGVATVTPASMAGITPQAVLTIDTGASQETVTVTTTTATTFTASFTLAHTTGFTITSSGNSPNRFGPWLPVSGYQGYTSNTDIVDMTGTYWDLYRVQPIIQTAQGQLTLPMSRAFKATDILYDVQISALINHFRVNYLDDRPIYHFETTNPSEGSGASIMPFITDSTTSRFNLAFIPNANPIKVIEDEVIVWQGSNKSLAQPMTPYQDFFVDEQGGYIDFAIIPSTNNYLKVEYKQVRYTNDECRDMLLNAVSSLSLWGINGYELRKSNNLLYLVNSIPNRDLGEIICMIAAKTMLQSKVQSSFEAAEAWKDGKIEYTADPSRSIQAASLFANDLDESIRHRANGYIISSRSSNTSQGEFDSFFNTSGILPVYSMIVSNYNAFGWWL